MAITKKEHTNDEAGRPSPEEAAEKEAENTEVDDSPIVPIAHDFLREDMNEVRDKLNQVIKRVNNL